MEAAVAERLPVLVLLGQDLPWKQLIVQQMTPEELDQCTRSQQEGEAFAVMTRGQTWKEKEAEEQQKLEESGAATQLEMGPESEIVENDGVEENDEAEEEPSYDFVESTNKTQTHKSSEAGSLEETSAACDT